jgi:hypothetical protein
MLSVTYAECHIRAFYAECRYSECPYAECHGALQVTQSTKERKFIKCFQRLELFKTGDLSNFNSLMKIEKRQAKLKI